MTATEEAHYCKGSVACSLSTRVWDTSRLLMQLRYGSSCHLLVRDALSSSLLGCSHITAVSVMGFYWLKEPIARFEIGCGLVAFAGCVLVIQPTFLFTAEQSITAHDRMIGSALVLGTVILDAATKIAVRSVGTNVHPLISIHWMASVILIGSGIIGLAVPSMAKGVTAFSWLNAVMITLVSILLQSGGRTSDHVPRQDRRRWIPGAILLYDG